MSFKNPMFFSNNALNINEPDKEIKVVVAEEIQIKPLRSYVVVLHDSDVHTPSYVVKMLQEICKLSEADAIEAAKKVHTEGRAVVYQSHRELCELKQSQIEAYGKDDLAIKAGHDCKGGMFATVEPQ
jgi:ATP-dependent Clp protease adapter protein ClpS